MSIYATLLAFDDFDPEDEPYVYVGSHRTANPKMRGGCLFLCEAVPWCTEHPYLRVSVHDHKPDGSAVLIDVDQARQLAARLTSWVEHVDSGAWREYGDRELEGREVDLGDYVPESVSCERCGREDIEDRGLCSLCLDAEPVWRHFGKFLYPDEPTRRRERVRRRLQKDAATVVDNDDV